MAVLVGQAAYLNSGMQKMHHTAAAAADTDLAAAFQNPAVTAGTAPAAFPSPGTVVAAETDLAAFLSSVMQQSYHVAVVVVADTDLAAFPSSGVHSWSRSSVRCDCETWNFRGGLWADKDPHRLQILCRHCRRGCRPSARRA